MCGQIWQCFVLQRFECSLFTRHASHLPSRPLLPSSPSSSFSSVMFGEDLTRNQQLVLIIPYRRCWREGPARLADAKGCTDNLSPGHHCQRRAAVMRERLTGSECVRQEWGTDEGRWAPHTLMCRGAGAVWVLLRQRWIREWWSEFLMSGKCELGVRWWWFGGRSGRSAPFVLGNGGWRGWCWVGNVVECSL